MGRSYKAIQTMTLEFKFHKCTKQRVWGGMHLISLKMSEDNKIKDKSVVLLPVKLANFSPL